MEPGIELLNPLSIEDLWAHPRGTFSDNTQDSKFSQTYLKPNCSKDLVFVLVQMNKIKS